MIKIWILADLSWKKTSFTHKNIYKKNISSYSKWSSAERFSLETRNNKSTPKTGVGNEYFSQQRFLGLHLDAYECYFYRGYVEEERIL